MPRWGTRSVLGDWLTHWQSSPQLGSLPRPWWYPWHCPHTPYQRIPAPALVGGWSSLEAPPTHPARTQKKETLLFTYLHSILSQPLKGPQTPPTITFFLSYIQIFTHPVTQHFYWALDIQPRTGQALATIKEMAEAMEWGTASPGSCLGSTKTVLNAHLSCLDSGPCYRIMPLPVMVNTLNSIESRLT